MRGSPLRQRCYFGLSALPLHLSDLFGLPQHHLSHLSIYSHTDSTQLLSLCCWPLRIYFPDLHSLLHFLSFLLCFSYQLHGMPLWQLPQQLPVYLHHRLLPQRNGMYGLRERVSDLQRVINCMHGLQPCPWDGADRVVLRVCQSKVHGCQWGVPELPWDMSGVFRANPE